MSRCIAFVAALLSTAGFATATLAQSTPARVAALDWMTGTWTHTTPTVMTRESWLGPGNGLMVAVNLTTTSSGKKSFEFLRIGETAEGFSYFASPGGKAPTEFRLKELGDRKVVFENAAHDFPQRILYWREGEQLLARVEGSIGGKPRSEEWRFDREASR